MTDLVVVSLFDGLSGGRIALDRVPHLNVLRYYSSEIDKYAIKVADKNYPQDTPYRLGSVIDIDGIRLKEEIEHEFPGAKILLIGGSPCQGFSMAGKLKGSCTKEGVEVTSLQQYLDLKSKGFEFDGQSYLFWEYIRLGYELQPTYYMLENVKVTKKWLPMFNEAMGVDPIKINSSLVSAQNRDRYYWTNIDNIVQPKDSDTSLSDTLEKQVDSSYNLSEKANFRAKNNPRSRAFKQGQIKAGTLLANQYKQSTDALYALLYGFTDRWRKLTPIECERLQTLPDNYTSKGLDIRSQLCYNDGNDCNIKENQWQKNVKSKDVVSQSQVRRLVSATNTILDSLDMEQQNLLENLSISLKTVLPTSAKENSKLLKGSVLSVIKLGNELNQVMIPKHVQFVMSLSETGHLECVLNTTSNTDETVMLYTLRSGNVYLMETKESSIIKTTMVNGLIEELLVRPLEDLSKTEKLCITLILINLIMSQAILSCSQTQNTLLSIDSLNQLQGNSLETDLLNLRTESITDVSNSARYKMIGNGWTIDVIAHILSHIP